MIPLKGLNLKSKNLKCFGQKAEGFDTIKLVNVIIGRNNSGKSSLIDLLEYATVPDENHLASLAHKATRPSVFFDLKLTEDALKNVFAAGSSGGPIPDNHQRYGLQFVGQKLTLQITSNKLTCIHAPDTLFTGIQDHVKNEKVNLLAQNASNPFLQYKLKRIYAERDISPELQSNSNQTVTGRGEGATAVIQGFLNFRHRKKSLVEVDLLNALNEIFNPDSYFERITAQLDEASNKWEIYLYEARKGGWIALSQSGSGLKTIILVLINLILVPEIENARINQYIFAFEELENNLHPAIQKRLFSYLYKQAQINDVHFVFTTHSNVVIDLFSDKEDTQLLHISHNGEVATVSPVTTYGSKKTVLDDLEFKASDLLQSNGVVWVEGPSDRVYINKWIHEYSEGKLQEGIHYQCLIYGGALKSHLSAEVPDEVAKAIAILNINQNAVFFTDRDRDTATAKLKATVIRLKEEFFQHATSLFFITEGREIENYIPVSSVRSAFDLEGLEQIERFAKADEYISYLQGMTGLKSLDKVQLANKVSEFLSKEELDKMYKLRTEMKKVVTLISSWNKKSENLS